MKQKFLKCEHCGNIVGVVKESGVPLMCCGEKMQEIIPGTVEASKEKHIPVYKIEGNKDGTKKTAHAGISGIIE